jgi:hypothetical protein
MVVSMTKDGALSLALEALESASNAIESWGSYASEYFQDKHDLQVDINNTQQAITAIKAALEAKDEAWECVCGANLYIDANGIPRSKASVEPATVMFKPEQEAKDEPVQVSPLQFVEMVMEKEHLVGKPIFWAEWPNKENT